MRRAVTPGAAELVNDSPVRREAQSLGGERRARDIATQVLQGVPAAMETHGVSLAPLLLGQEPAEWRDAIYYHYSEYPQPHRVARHRGVRTERRKLIEYYERGEWELFDLAEDPDELTSAHADPEYAEVREELTTRLAALRAEFGDV